VDWSTRGLVKSPGCLTENGNNIALNVILKISLSSS